MSNDTNTTASGHCFSNITERSDLNCDNATNSCTLLCLNPTTYFLSGPSSFSCVDANNGHGGQCLPWWSTEMTFGVGIGFVLMLFTIGFFMRPRPRPAENVAVGYVVFSVLSFSFDVYFIYFIWHFLPHASSQTLGLIGLGIPLFGSILFVPYVLIRESLKHPAFKAWVKEHSVAFVAGVFFSLICCDNFVLFACGLLGRASFCAPLKRARALRLAGLLLTVIGGVLRMAASIPYVTQTGTFVIPAGPSLVFTGVCILSRLSICKCWREVDSEQTQQPEAQPTAPVVDPIVLMHLRTRQPGDPSRPSGLRRQLFLNDFRKNSSPYENPPHSSITSPAPNTYTRVNNTPGGGGGGDGDSSVPDIYGAYLSLDREPTSPQLHRQASVNHYRPNIIRTPTHAGGTVTLSTTMSVQPQVKEIDFTELKFLSEIGKGHFNSVYSVLWRGGIIAGKRPNQAVTLDEFIDELYIHQLLGNHPHVVKFIGACTIEPNLCILLELMPQKSLEELLVKNKKFQDEKDFGIVAQIVSDAAAGLLHLHREGVIHRDVAARNFLCNAQNRTTICDFGLSRQMAKMMPDGKTVIGRTGTLLGPIKWMAPECLQAETDAETGEKYQIYNEQTDTYMFGVFLWEVFARSEPYPGLNERKAAEFVANENGGLDLNMCRCPPAYRELIQSCLSRDPKLRPSMDTVANTLRELSEEIRTKAEKRFFTDGLHVPSPKHSPSNSLSASREGGAEHGGGVSSAGSTTGSSLGYTKIDTIAKEIRDSDSQIDPSVFLHLPGQLERSNSPGEGSTPPPGDSVILHTHSDVPPDVSNYVALS